MSESLRPDATEALTATLRERIMVIDGAMGTAIQRDRPSEAGYRGERFADWPSDLQGNNDLLTLTQPEIIAGIHREYLEAGADILETNTFNANAVSLADYGMEELAHELNLEAARLARRGRRRGVHARAAAVRRRRPRADHAHRVDLAGRQRPGRPQRQLRPARRGVQPRPPAACSRAAPTCCSSRRSSTRSTPRPRSSRSRRVFEEYGRRWPVIVSGTITDASGRTLSGQVTEAFWDSIRHVEPDRGRAQLRAGRQGDAALHRRDVPDRGLLRLLLPERRAAQRLRRVRRGARGDRGVHRRVRRGRVRQPGRRLLRHDPGPHRRHRGRRARTSTGATPTSSRRPCGCPASSRSRSPRTACSSTSASARTSPARPGSATSSRTATTTPP